MNKNPVSPKSRDVMTALRQEAALRFPPAFTPLGFEAADRCLGGGLQQGALHEVCAASMGGVGAASGFTAALALRVSAQRQLLWAREDFAGHEYGEISALGLLELGLDPDRLILVKARDAQSVLRAAHEALSCAGLGAVIAEITGTPKILDLTASRRLVLAAARKSVTAFLLRHRPDSAPSAAQTRWLVRPARSPAADHWGRAQIDAALWRHRHGATGRWVMEWRREDGCFAEPQCGLTAHSGALAAASAGRPDSAGFAQDTDSAESEFAAAGFGG